MNSYELRIAELEKQRDGLAAENAALKGSVENAAGCINAAYAEGLIDALAESEDERLVDLVKPRLLLAYIPVETPDTDAAIAEIGANAVELAIERLTEKFSLTGRIGVPVMVLESFAKELRGGGV